MKKLIAILVVFGLLTTAVFAQADFSAGGATKTTLIEGHTEADDPWTGFSSWFWVSAGKTNEEGTMGAKGSISINTGLNRQLVGVESEWIDTSYWDDDDGVWVEQGHLAAVSGVFVEGSQLNISGDDTWFYAWWQPIDQLFIKMGKVGEDGRHWAGADIMGWGFQSNDMLVGIDFDYYNGFAGHLLGDGFAFFDAGLCNHTALQISILPMDGLAINLGFNMGGLAEAAFVDSLALQVVYQIPNIGEAAIGFKNAGKWTGEDEEGEEYEYDGDRNVYLQFSMPISNMKIEAGLQFTIRDDVDPVLGVGLGFRYGNEWGDQFWATARLGIQYDLESKDMIVGFGVCPSYDLGMFRIYVPIDIAMDMPDEGDSMMYWGINPYIRRQMGGLEVWAGFYAHNGYRWPWMGSWAYNGKAAEDVVNWGIPVGFLWAW